MLWLQDYVGPTEESNWVLLGRMLVGAYPSSQDDALNDQILTSILQLGVTTFVCLQVRLLPGATVRCGGVVWLHSWASHTSCVVGCALLGLTRRSTSTRESQVS